MSWFKIAMTFYDGATIPPLKKKIELTGSNLPYMLQEVVQLILQAQKEAAQVPWSHLHSMQLLPIELTEWTSSSACGKPEQEERHLLQTMRASVVAFLSSGVGSPSESTPTGSSDSSPN
jgi:hypothetical protein